MNGVRSRRQAADKKGAAANGKTNGGANGHAGASAEDDDYPRENIFLFWPNVIGMYC